MEMATGYYWVLGYWVLLGTGLLATLLRSPAIERDV
jgi:hypothetical protein